MKKNEVIKIIKIINILLIILWMAVVFAFSNEKGDKSTNTSRKVTNVVLETVTASKPEEQTIEQVDKVIRKIAHYTLYTIGGILIISYAYTTEKNNKTKILYSIAFGAGYAMTDEIHQFFVSKRNASIIDVGIDTLGIITGIILYLIIRKFIIWLKEKHKS